LLANGQWFSPGIPASSTTKTDRHDIAEILLKVALNTKNQSNPFKTLSCGGGYLGILIYIKCYNFVWDHQITIHGIYYTLQAKFTTKPKYKYQS
jgi:hypothetical protein